MIGMKPNTLASVLGIIGCAVYLWLYSSGVGYPLAAASLAVSVLVLVSAASLVFNSRKALALAEGASFVSLAYSGFLISELRQPLEGLALALAAAYLLAASYAYRRYGKTKYITPLDMPVYG